MNSLIEIGISNAITACVLATVVVLISRFIRRPAVIHTLWVLVLLKLVTPPIVQIPIGYNFDRVALFAESDANESPQSNFSSPELAVTLESPIIDASSGDHSVPIKVQQRIALTEQNIADESETESITSIEQGSMSEAWQVSPTIQFMVIAGFVVWCIGTGLWFLIQSVRIMRFCRFIDHAKLAPVELQHQTSALAKTLNLHRAPEIWIIPGAISPMLWSIGTKARLLFPTELLDRLDEDQRATLIVHELAHYRRGDHWVRLLEFFVTGLFWWHPLVWWARHAIETAEEECCDAWVVDQFPSAPRCYAEAILDTIDFISEQRPCVPPVASGIGNVPFLRRRLTLIMRGVAPKSMSGSSRLALLVAAVVALPLGPQLFDSAVKQAEAAVALINENEHVPPIVDSPRIVSIEDYEENESAVSNTPTGEDRTIEPTVETAVEWAKATSNNRRFAVSKMSNGTVRLIDSETEKQFDLTRYQVNAVAFSPDNTNLALASADHNVHLFDCRSGHLLVSLRGHSSAIQSVAFSPDGRYIASGSASGAVRLWNVRQRQLQASLVDVHMPISCIRYSPDGTTLAIAAGSWMSAEGGGRVSLVDIRSRKTIDHFDAPSSIGALTYQADENLLAIEWSGRVTMWNSVDRRIHNMGSIDKNLVSTVAFSPNNTSTLVFENDGRTTASDGVLTQR